MSHVVSINLEVRDLDALAAAAASLGLEFVRGQQTYRWYGRSVGASPLPAGFAADDLGKCDHAIRVPGSGRAYEIGVAQRRDGKPGYVLLLDEWANGFGLIAKCGQGAAALKREYAVEVATKTLRQQGRQVTVQRLANGSVRVVGSR